MQIEQDTGKTVTAPPVALVDLNRVGTPLVEIITDPFPVSSGEVPAKVLAKIQSRLKAVGACVLGMEWGGLRADVNVSVAPKGSGVLGQRCEIKNLSSFGAVRDAVMAEAERQVEVLERGGEVKGETRGWDAEKGRTTRLRGKEGEVEYRYMPDPELPAVRLGDNVVEKALGIMPMLPEAFLSHLVNEYGVSVKDAKTLLALNDGSTGSGGVVGYLKSIVATLLSRFPDSSQKETGKLVANWVLHELGGQLGSRQIDWPDNPLPAERLSELLALFLENHITAPTAKKLLPRLLDAPEITATEIIDKENLRVLPISDEELVGVIRGVMETKRGKDVIEQLRTMAGDESDKVVKKRGGLMSFILGNTMKELKGRVPAKKVEEVVGRVVEGEVKGE